MEVLLSKVTQHAMNHAIRSGIAITSGYAIRQCSRLLKTVKGTEKEELASLQFKLESKIRIISPAIDMIELIAARGNTSLESAVTLTKALRWDIQALGVRLAKAAGEEELSRRGSSRAKSAEQHLLELRLIISDIKKLLDRIEDAVPLINLAITTSGVSLSTNLPSTVSPSRLLQASTFLTAGDSQYAMSPSRHVQIGPVFTLSMYMLFSGYASRPHDEEGIRETTWKEVIHKARVKLLRVPLTDVYAFPTADEVGLHHSRNEHVASEKGDDYFPQDVPAEGKAYEFAYQLFIVEDLDDGRVHTFEENEPQPGPFGDVSLAGIREIIPIHEISKIFYADTGKILNIGTEGETNSPVLLFKRDINAPPPRRMMKQDLDGPQWYDEPNTDSFNETPNHPNESHLDEEDEAAAQLRRESSAAVDEQADMPPSTHPWRLPPNLDPEWIAFEVYTEEPDSDDEDDEVTTPVREASPVPSAISRSRSGTPGLTAALANLNVTSSPPASARSSPGNQVLSFSAPPSSIPALRTSLSLLELLIRLTALQQFQQSSHLAITDELLNFFLSDSSTTGAGADGELRRRVRREARMRVGFDPYDESPIKRRGEDYVAEHGHAQPGEWDEGWDEEGGYAPAQRRTMRGSSPYAYPSSGNWRTYDEGEDDVDPRPSTNPTPAHNLARSSPSPSLRHSTGYDRGTRGATPERQMSQPPFTPPGTTKSRQVLLRKESNDRRPSPLSRAFSGGSTAGRDSGVGTSPDS